MGQDTVTLNETGPLHRINWTYNAKTGMLSAMTTMQQIGLAQITQNLHLTDQQ